MMVQADCLIGMLMIRRHSRRMQMPGVIGPIIQASQQHDAAGSDTKSGRHGADRYGG